MTDERAMRFGYLLSEIEIAARKILDGRTDDVPFALVMMKIQLDEVCAISKENSREALDKVAGTRPSPHPFEGSGQRCLACGDARSMHPLPEDAQVSREALDKVVKES